MHVLVMWARFEDTPPFICWVTEFGKLSCELAFEIPAFRKTLDQQYTVLLSCLFCFVQHVDAEGTGPEYDYPTTEKDEPIPVVKEGEEVPLGGEGTEPVVGEDDRELTDAEIAGTTEKFFTLKYVTLELCC